MLRFFSSFFGEYSYIIIYT